MSKIHLVIGPVGAGKSTYVETLRSTHHAVAFNLDQWMAKLYGDDERPKEGRVEWYVERSERCLDVIWALACDCMRQGTSVVMEVGLIQRDARERFYGRIDAEAFDHAVYVVDAPRDVRRERVKRRNEEQGATFSIAVPMPFFEFASDLWEPPTAQESSDRRITLVTT